MTQDEDFEKLEASVRRELGEQKFARLKELQRQAQQALHRGDFEKSYELDRQMEALVDPKADLSKPSPATCLAMLFEQLIKGDATTPVQDSLRRLYAALPRLASLLSSIFHGSPDQFERSSTDDKAVRKELHLFAEHTITVLLREADSAANAGNPVFAERIYEITQHALKAKGDSSREIAVAFKAARLCEQLGRFVSAMD